MQSHERVHLNAIIQPSLRALSQIRSKGERHALVFLRRLLSCVPCWGVPHPQHLRRARFGGRGFVDGGDAGSGLRTYVCHAVAAESSLSFVTRISAEVSMMATQSQAFGPKHDSLVVRRAMPAD